MKLTKEQGIILTGFTGNLCSSFGEFHADVEKRMGRPVFSHEFGDEEFSDHIKELYRNDFLNIMPEETDNDT